MFEYCKARHIDPSYEFFGTADYAILDMDSRTMLMYSIVQKGDQFVELSFVQPMKFEAFVGVNRIKGNTLRELFIQGSKQKNMKVERKCVVNTKEALLPLILKDARSLPPDSRETLETIIAETF